MRDQALATKLLDVNLVVDNEDSDLANFNGITFFDEDLVAIVIGRLHTVTAHATPTEPEPYEYTLAGRITEVGEDYFLLDDTLLCTDPAQGQVYRITCTDLRLVRHLIFEGLGVGDVVMVAYDGVLSEGNRVEGAYRINEGKIHGASLLVPD